MDDATSFAIDYCAANHTRVRKQTLESFIDEHYYIVGLFILENYNKNRF
jgi:hypothetical protein